MTHLFPALVLATILSAPGAQAQTCPPVPDRAQEVAGLLNAARQAPDQATGDSISNAMWAIWTDAPDARAQDLLDSGMARREMYDYAAAENAFDALIAYCPDYAEGWNQRAFIRFLRQDYEAALPDLDAALRLNPVHVGALSGKALTLLALGRTVQGQAVLREALDLNPWLRERAYLQPVPDDDL